MNRDSDEYKALLTYAMAAVVQFPMSSVTVLAAMAFADTLVTEEPERVTDIVASIMTEPTKVH